MTRLLPLLLLLLFAACGASKPYSSPEDRTLQRYTQAGRLAFEMERPEEAITQYRLALRRAKERDDLPAIGDLGYDLAVAELAANQPNDALATARATRAELQRRGAAVFPDLDFAEATALYRTGSLTDADALAARVQAASGPAAARASLLRGLIADERGDIPGLRAATAALTEATTKTQEADAAELGARLRLREADPRGARAAAEYSAELRRTTRDYRGVARALSVAAAAAQTEGDTAGAADLYLRAGRSAAAHGEGTQAREWLAHANALATDPSLRRAVQDEAQAEDPQSTVRDALSP